MRTSKTMGAASVAGRPSPKGARPPPRPLVFLHRWLGIALCLMFALWFVTGAVLLYVPFPSLSPLDARQHAAQVDPGRIAITPRQAIAAAARNIVDARLVQRIDGPAYVLTDADGRLIAIDAERGKPLPPISASQAAATARAFSGTAARAVSGPLLDDQWTVHQHFDPWRPLYRVDLDDAAGTQLYVAAASGEVVQRTTRHQRGWNWVGAVVHWIYPTILRRHWMWWNQTVWWLSLVALGVALLGGWLGIRQTLRVRQRRPGAWTPFRRWMRWHHLLGLTGGLVLLPWIFSGWLSMDHGRLFSKNLPDPAAAQIYRGGGLAQADGAWSLAALRALPPAGEIRFDFVGGHRYAYLSRPDGVGVVDGANGAGLAQVSDQAVLGAVQRAWPQRNVLRLEHPADSELYVAAEGLPEGLRRVVLDGPGDHWLYVDRGGRLLIDQDSSRRAYAWVYYAVHTLHFPFLTKWPVLHDAVVLLCLALGLALSLSGAIVGILRLKRTLAA